MMILLGFISAAIAAFALEVATRGLGPARPDEEQRER